MTYVPPYRVPRVLLRTGKGLRPAPPPEPVRAPVFVDTRKMRVRGPSPSLLSTKARNYEQPCPKCGAATGQACDMDRKGNRVHLERLR